MKYEINSQIINKNKKLFFEFLTFPLFECKLFVFLTKIYYGNFESS